VVGTFVLGTDFLCDGSVIVSDHNFLRFFPDRAFPTSHLDRVNVGVIQLSQGADPLEVQKVLRRVLPEDVDILTKRELIDRENEYWLKNSPIAFVFTLGMVVGFIIGVGICYQVLYTNVSHYLPQFAAMKAMGFASGELVRIVLGQATSLALLGFVFGISAAAVLFLVVGWWTGLVMCLTWFWTTVILVLSLAMCWLSGALAVRRVITVDPVEVFR
jgi:putative ABC transport system permease protein